MTAPPQSSTSNVRVVARIRPLSSSERAKGSQMAVETVGNLSTDDTEQVLQVTDESKQKRWFEFDAVLDGSSTQFEVYERSGARRAVCEDLFKGFNCTILAYGQTGSGKTFTMGTAAAENDDTSGIIPRATTDLFEQIQDRCDGNAQVELSYLEIYNEEIRDLMVHNNQTTPPALRIRENLNGEVYVNGLTSKPVRSPEEIGDYMQQAADRRVVAATQMNAVSSRSHAICVLNIKGVLEDDTKFHSKLTLVDLAGSERIKKTNAAGNRRQEGININKGLLILGQVVSALAEQRPKLKRKPPYRDSKLTRLLQDSLGGNSRTIMVACCSPADYNIAETVNTLRYATSARNIKNNATRNVIQSISPEEAQKLLRQNQLLQAQVKELQETIRGMTLSRSPSTDSIMVSDDEDMDAVSVDEDVDYEAKRIRDLEKEVRQLKSALAKQEKQAKKSGGERRPISQTVADSAIEVPELRKRVAQLEEELQGKQELMEENEQLQKELEEAKSDAHSALLAANKMSKILDQLKELKSDEIEKKRAENEHMKVEEAWVHFVFRILENNRDQMRKLKEDFALVARVVDSPEVMISRSQIDENEDANPRWFSRLNMLPSNLKQNMTSHDGHSRLSWSIHGGGSQNFFHGRQNFSMHGRARDNHPRVDPAIRQQLLSEHIRFFNDKLLEVENEMIAESNSMASIRESLRRQRDQLEQDIGASEFERASLIDRGQDKNLLDELTMLLVGPIKNLGDYP